MFGIVTPIRPPSATCDLPPSDVPPPTPVTLPKCNPQLPDASGPSGQRIHPSLVRFLQSLHRPNEVDESHFAALGTHVHVNVPAEQIVPDPSYMPSASGWDDMDLDEAKRNDSTFQRPLSNGRVSPETRIYLEKRAELSVENQAAFRVVRRMKPAPGLPMVRLGSSYEFFRQLEFMASYWDDSSVSILPRTASGNEQDPETTDTASRITYRTSAGTIMPPEFRHTTVTAFVKLVSYDFGCNIAPPRVEPRLYLTSPPVPDTQERNSPAPRSSYFTSGCVFVHRASTTREAARVGIVDGPIAAVSARNTTRFNTPMESNIDFGRELLAALVTAQLRDREGKEEKRIGEGQWWATEKRWGGGEGGPIGREVEGDAIIGDKDAVGTDSMVEGSLDSTNTQASSDKANAQGPGQSRELPLRGPPLNKKMRRTLTLYDRYRMVRLPSSNWDKKARYAAIGKVKGAGYDDVFVISSLFHHLCIMRVRVPDRLLAVFGGAPEDGAEEEKEGLSWGRLECWRSSWLDLFLVKDRLEAMRIIWGVMAWGMRQTDGGDVRMGNV
ncbi:hypothetical protein GGR50DRAFT_685541 [Xylaria sp. CBS 124048]|nr:hypothetical protein GGR50DRAFT_685541 [Xylaria sp. CBS 124048]